MQKSEVGGEALKQSVQLGMKSKVPKSRRHAKLDWPADPAGLRLHWQIFVFLASCAIIISRRPDAVFHAQFYAEDGAIWFGDAYNWGWWRALFWPFHGYIQILPRLAAGIALLVPVVYAPLVENLIAITVQALPVNLMLSSQSRTWGPMRLRVGMALLYLLLPNTKEMFGTVTESQWVLALCAFLLLAGSPPRSPAARASSFLILMLYSLTGPFCIFLFPIALFLLWDRRRESWSWTAVAILCLGSIVQGISLLTHRSSRGYPTLGASFGSAIRILGGNVYLGTLIGSQKRSMHLPPIEFACIAIIGSIVLLLCARGAKREIRSLLALSVLLFAASLARPVVYPTPGTTAWQAIAKTPGLHYWFLPSLAIAWSLAWCAYSGAKALRIVSCFLLVLMVVGLIRDYRYPPFPDLRFSYYAKQLASAPPNSVVVIPVNPPGWSVRLSKR